MRQWSFEVRDGVLSGLPPSLRTLTDEQRTANAHCFFVAEGGTLLNEPDDTLVESISWDDGASVVLGHMSKAVAWLFGRMETELDQDFRFNYLKLAFVNLNPQHARGDQHAGKMTTNAVDLPEGVDVSAAMVLHHMATAVRLFFSHVQGAVQLDGWQSEAFACDWVTMTFNKT